MTPEPPPGEKLRLALAYIRTQLDRAERLAEEAGEDGAVERIRKAQQELEPEEEEP